MTNLSDDVRNQIIDALRSGQKISAIKLYREATGADLKEAKDFVEALTERLAEEMPGQFQKPSGCVGTVLLFLVATVTLTIAWMA